MDRMTLDDLAPCMRGMPRNAVILIRAPDGTLHRLRQVTGLDIGPHSKPSPLTDGASYAILLETDDEAEPGT